MDKSIKPSTLLESYSYDSENENNNNTNNINKDAHFEIHDYDYDVVDDALNNPHQSEYYDHFGFKIQVKTDDEESDDSSDDDEEEEQQDLKEFNNNNNNNNKQKNDLSSYLSDNEHTTTTAPTHFQNSSITQTKNNYSNGYSHNVKSTTSTSSSSASASDEDEYSVDTTLTTPTSTLKLQRLSASSELFNELNSTDFDKNNNIQKSQRNHHSNTHFDNEQQHNHHHIDHSTPPRSSQSSQTRPASKVYSSKLSSETFTRPSQAFRERQNKRMSEISNCMSPIRSIADYSLPLSSSSSKRLSTASIITNGTSNSSYYDILKAKFKRTSNETEDLDRESPLHIKLRQDTLKLLEKEQKLNPYEYDWEFWKSMILDVDKTVTTQALSLKNYISVGLPPQLRGSLWQLISKSRNQSSDMEGTYWELLKRTSPFEKEIQHDLDHSFPLSNFFSSNMSGHNNDTSATKCQSIYNILKAYSLFDQDTGYSQGLSYIIALFLTQIDDEVAVFCLIVQLMGPYGLKGHLALIAETLQLQLYQFDHLLELTLPELHRYLGNLGVRPETYASKWFTTCFSYQSNSSLAAKVMDLVFIEGTQVLQRFILALLKRNQHIIMEIGFEHLMKYFQNSIFDVYKGNENEFVIDMYMIDIPTKLHTRLAKQFKNEMARKEKQRNQEEMMRQANEQLMTYIQELQEKYRVLEMEHQEMTRQAVETKMSMAKMNSDNDSLMHQLKQLRSQHESTERHKDTEHQSRIEEIYQSNRHLIKQNASLQDQIADMEAVLIGLKMNYAERETEYESLRRQLLDAQKAAQKN